MGERFVLRVGRKGAIYLPRRVMRDMGIGEGDLFVLRREGNRLVLEFIPDPFMLAVRSRKWAWTSVEEFERESVVEQEETVKGSG